MKTFPGKLKKKLLSDMLLCSDNLYENDISGKLYIQPCMKKYEISGKVYIQVKNGVTATVEVSTTHYFRANLPQPWYT